MYVIIILLSRFIWSQVYGSYTPIDTLYTGTWLSINTTTWDQYDTLWSQDSWEDERVRLDLLYRGLPITPQETTWLIATISYPIATGLVDVLDNQRDNELMARICKYGRYNGKTTPLCNNWELYNQGKQAFSEIPNSRPIALGIMYSESHLWVSYAWSCDSSWNNRWWIKAKKLDNGRLLKDQPIPNNGSGGYWGCRLYKFENMQDYFKSKANTLIDWYRWCRSKKKPITCIAYRYVGNKYIAEESWIRRVAKISQ